MSIVVKSKLVIVLSLFLFTLLQLPIAASLILELYYARSDSRDVIQPIILLIVKCEILRIPQGWRWFRNILAVPKYPAARGRINRNGSEIS